MASDTKDLSWILGTRDSVAALEGYYGQVWDKILRELALGLGRPGAAFRTGLVLRLKALVGTLDPYRNSIVRRWLREWASASVVLGERNAMDSIKAQIDSSSPAAATDFGGVEAGKSDRTLPLTASLVDATAAHLAMINAQMLLALNSVVHRIQTTVLGRASSGGVLGGLTQKNLGGDLAELVLRGKVPAAEAALRRLGFPQGLLNDLEGLSEARIYPQGSGMPDLGRSVANAGSGMISDGHGQGVKNRSQENDVDHVRISNPNRVGPPDVCTVFAGHVFYIGMGGKDPLGFPALRDIPNGGPKFHPNCRHNLQPYVIALKDKAEIQGALDAVGKIPKDFFNVKPYSVTKAVRKLAPSKVNPGARAPRGEKVA